MDNSHKERNWQSRAKTFALSAGGATVIAGAAIAGFAALRYRVARPSEFVVRTGWLIDNVAVDKKAFQLPFQTAKLISVQPSNYTFNLQAMSKEKMEFILPGVYTIGPKVGADGDLDPLKRYAVLMSNTNNEERENIIKGIIEGETRVLTASLTLEQIFSGRDEFRDHVTERVDKELGGLGLVIHNANIQEMSDHEGSEYFQYLRQRARATAEAEARKNIAEAQRDGDVSVKDNEKDTRIKKIGFEAEAVQFENERNIEIAESTKDLQVRQAEFNKASEIARIESEKMAEMRLAEMQRDVETRRIEQEKERLRSELLTKATVEAEAVERSADAHLYQKQKEAQGILARFDAEAEGLQKLFETSSDPKVVLNYLMIDRGLFPELAKANAEAIKGLEPKITYWNTGGGSDGKGANPITDIVKNIPPLVDTIYQQTGMAPADWLMNTSEYKKRQVSTKFKHEGSPFGPNYDDTSSGYNSALEKFGEKIIENKM